MNLSLTNWPVARRLFAVIVAALLMGLVFGGLRVADAENSASQLSRTEQLARLGVQLTGVVDDLQNERDATLVALITGDNAGADPVAGQDERGSRPGTDGAPVHRDRRLPRDHHSGRERGEQRALDGEHRQCHDH